MLGHVGDHGHFDSLEYGVELGHGHHSSLHVGGRNRDFGRVDPVLGMDGAHFTVAASAHFLATTAAAARGVTSGAAAGLSEPVGEVLGGADASLEFSLP